MIKRLDRTVLILLLLVFTIGVMLMWWTGYRTDKHMRSELLEQARIAAQAINIERVATLSGSERDLNTSSYKRIKSQLALMRKARHQCRFLYLMGQRSDGTVFFFVDSLPEDSKDYAPPGLVYEEVSDSYLRAFDAKQEAVVGPVTDRWGTLVTALVPLKAPHTRNIGALLGMDIDAKDWNKEILGRCSIPFAAMLFFTVLILLLTSRGQAIKALSESEEKYRRLFESLVDVFYQTDSFGKITMVSPSITKAAGYKPEEVIGSDLKDYYKNPGERDNFLELISTNGFVENFEVQMKKRDGSVLWALVNAGPSRDKEGNVVGVEGIARDITQRKQVEEEREKLIKELQGALKEIKTLRGILPLCSFCKKIRDDKGYWEQVDVYINKHLQADISHGICPECAEKHYPDFDLYDDEED